MLHLNGILGDHAGKDGDSPIHVGGDAGDQVQSARGTGQGGRSLSEPG